MICDTCQRRDNCLPWLMAASDQQILKMLDRLQQCKLRIFKQKQAKNRL